MRQTAPEQRPTPSRRTLVLIVGPILAVIVLGILGNAFHPWLLENHPLWLVAAEPRNRFLILVADKVSFVPFLVVATLRRLVSDPLFYLLGYLYGAGAVRWAEKRFDNDSGLVRAIERAFHKAGPVLVFFFPGAIVCVLAGVTGMNPVLFLLLNVAGTITIVTLVYRSAGIPFVDGPLDAINGFYSRNAKWLTAVTVALTAFWLWDQRRKGRSELQSISSIEQDLHRKSEDGEGGQEGERRQSDQSDARSATPEPPPSRRQQEP